MRDIFQRWNQQCLMTIRNLMRDGDYDNCVCLYVCSFVGNNNLLYQFEWVENIYGDVLQIAEEMGPVSEALSKEEEDLFYLHSWTGRS